MVAADASGNFVVVWHELVRPGRHVYGVFGQRYDSAGEALGAEFRVNSYTTDSQAHARRRLGRERRTSSSSGTASSRTASSYGIFGQRFDSAGGPLGGEFRVNSYTTSRQSFPCRRLRREPATSSSSGGSYDQDGSGYGIFGQRFDSAGVRSGRRVPRQHVHDGSPATSPPSPPTRAGTSSSSGAASGQDGSDLRRLRPAVRQRGRAPGRRVPRELLHDGTQQRFPSVAADRGRELRRRLERAFDQCTAALTGVFGQRYDSAGQALGGEFRVNSYTRD